MSEISDLPAISVVVPTLARPEKLKRCLSALQEACHCYREHGAQCEVIVIDQTPDKRSSTQLRGNLERYIHLDRPGTSRARNFGIMRATYDIVAFTDDDCIPESDWLLSIGRMLLTHPDVDVVFGHTEARAHPKCSYRHEVQEGRFGFDWHGVAENGDRCFATITKKEAEIISGRCLPYARLGSSNNMACRKCVFERHGLFCELLGAGALGVSAEDTEFQYRLLKKAVLIAYDPSLKVQHDNWLGPLPAWRQLSRYTCGTTAVFVMFGLRADITAWRFVSYIFFQNVFSAIMRIQKAGLKCTMFPPLSRIVFWLIGFANGLLLGVMPEHWRVRTLGK